MIGIGTLSKHPNQMKTPCSIFKFNKFFTVIRMNFHGEIVFGSEFKNRFVFFIKNTSPSSDGVHKMRRQTQKLQSQFFNATFYFPQGTTNKSGVNHKS